MTNTSAVRVRYEHTQRNPVLPLILCVGAAFALAALFLPSSRPLPLGVQLTIVAAAIAMVGSGLVFSRLTTMVDGGELAWHFGAGLMRKSVPLAEVASAEPARTSAWEGWGVHLTMRGWLYNVSGREAVLVTMRDGKRFLLGTDEPAALMQAIRGG